MIRSLSIVIPAYNEERRLPATLERILDYLGGARLDFAEVLVVDDGSMDKTAAVAAYFGEKHASVRLLRNPGNRGKGYSVRHGVTQARGSWILFTDADLSSPLSEFSRLEEAAGNSGAQVAIGSRALDRSLVGVHQPVLRETAGRFFNLVMRLITGLPFRDTQCGFKLFAADAAREIFRRQLLDGFGFDVEVLMLAKLMNFKAVEVPVRWNDVQGTKVSMFRGLAAFLDPLRVQWNRLRGRYR